MGFWKYIVPFRRRDKAAGERTADAVPDEATPPAAPPETVAPVAASEEAVPEAPPEPEQAAVEAYRRWWRDAVREGARFRIDEDDTFKGYQFGEPYQHLRLARENDPEALPFADAAERLYYLGQGAILCREGWSADRPDDLDCHFLSYGDLVDYRMGEELVAREPATLGWGIPADLERVRIEAPDFTVLLPCQRSWMEIALKRIGMIAPKTALLTDHEGRRSLVFNLHAHFPDRDRAGYISAYINYFLPRHYCQVVFGNDADVAVFPLQPFDSRDMEKLLDRLQFAEFHERCLRAAARESPPAPLRPPSASERRWRELAVNPQARFRLDPDDWIRGNDGMPYVAVRPARPEEQGCSFRAAALLLADRGMGAVLCRTGWAGLEGRSREEVDRIQLTLSLGDLVDYLMTGRLERRLCATEGWLQSVEYYMGRFSEPDVLLLPLQSRQMIESILREAGIEEPKVALQTIPDGRKLLHFSGFEAVGREGSDCEDLIRRIRWCLPGHYSVFLLDTPDYLRWPLWPTEAAPSEEEFDLGTEDEEGES